MEMAYYKITFRHSAGTLIGVEVKGKENVQPEIEKMTSPDQWGYVNFELVGVEKGRH